jgi:hypothetical protein
VAGDGVARVGSVRLELTGGEGGIEGWSLQNAQATELDGLPTKAAPAAPRLETAVRHPNTAVRIDHLVVFTPQLKRTIAAFEGAGLDLRRLREPDEPGPPVRQAFFRAGEVICEVVENPRADEGPAAFWGITLCVADLDRCADLLGPRMGEIHDAVQPGRRIATARRDAKLGIPVAFIDEGAGRDSSGGTP